MQYNYKIYDNIFKILSENNCLNVSENEYQDFKLLLCRTFNKLSLVNSLSYINNIYLINSTKLCKHEVTDEIIKSLLNHY